MPSRTANKNLVLKMYFSAKTYPCSTLNACFKLSRYSPLPQAISLANWSQIQRSSFTRPFPAALSALEHNAEPCAYKALSIVRPSDVFEDLTNGSYHRFRSESKEIKRVYQSLISAPMRTVRIWGILFLYVKENFLIELREKWKLDVFIGCG